MKRVEKGRKGEEVDSFPSPLWSLWTASLLLFGPSTDSLLVSVDHQNNLDTPSVCIAQYSKNNYKSCPKEAEHIITKKILKDVSFGNIEICAVSVLKRFGH